MMIMSKIKAVTVHGGHNPQGKIACGASDYIDESNCYQCTLEWLRQESEG